jgi:hypothetical protein
MTGSPEQVDHPAHYTGHPSGVECITVVEWFGFNLGNAIKYIWRAGDKRGEDTVTALRKARWYLDREIARLEGLRSGG